MEYLIVLNVILLSVVLGFLITYTGRENTPNSIDASKSKNITATTKQCPCCAKEIKVDAIKCKNCGSLINNF